MQTEGLALALTLAVLFLDLPLQVKRVEGPAELTEEETNSNEAGD